MPLYPYVIYIIGIVNFLIGTILIFLIGIFTTGKLFELAINIFSRMIVFLGGVGSVISGRENILPGKKYIVMMNHVNIFDAILLKSTFWKKVRGIEEETHMSWPIYGHLMKRIGMIPINRKNARRADGISEEGGGELLKDPKGSLRRDHAGGDAYPGRETESVQAGRVPSGA